MTRCSAAGRKVHGAGWQHDAAPRRRTSSATAPASSWWPSWSGCRSAPARWACRCWPASTCPARAGPRQGGDRRRPVRQLALAFPGRIIHVVADAAYHGPALRTLPGNVTWTCRIPRNAVLYDLAPPRTGGGAAPAPGASGSAPPMTSPPPRAGPRSPSPPTAAGRPGTSPPSPACGTVLAHREVRLILARNQRTTSGYDLALVTTDPDASPAALVTRYAARWGIEQAFADARHVLAREARNRPGAPRAHRPVRPARAHLDHLLVHPLRPSPGHIDDRRAAQPWYRTKHEPAFKHGHQAAPHDTPPIPPHSSPTPTNPLLPYPLLEASSHLIDNSSRPRVRLRPPGAGVSLRRAWPHPPSWSRG